MPEKLINRSSLSEQLTDILKESIINGTYKDREKLPSEMELTKIYNVSRMTVRAALQRLNALGLVTTKAGDGTYVNQFKLENYLNDISTLLTKPNIMNDIKDFRKLIDIECLRLAIDNHTKEDLKELKNICDAHRTLFLDIKEINDELFRTLAEIDYDIHYKICEMSKNYMFIVVYKTCKELLMEYVYTIMKIRHKRSLELDSTSFVDGMEISHQRIYDAIKNRNFEAAKKDYLNHIDYQILYINNEDYD